MASIVDVTGQRFGRLTVLGRSARMSAAGALWDCRCDCGGETVTTSLKLRSGHTASCGCLRHEATTMTHGHANKTPTYRSWKEMRQRCYNPKSDKFHWYGGRGIAVCDQWASYATFLADMGERPPGMTLDRIDNDCDYEPHNCRWATQVEQTRKQKKNKLSPAMAETIRADHASGMSYRAIGRKHGVSATSANRCALGKTWA